MIVGSVLHKLIKDPINSYQARSGDVDKFSQVFMENFMFAHYKDVSSFHNKVEHLSKILADNLRKINKDKERKDKKYLSTELMILTIENFVKNHEELFNFSKAEDEIRAQIKDCEHTNLFSGYFRQKTKIKFKVIHEEKNLSLFGDNFTIKKGIKVPIIAFLGLILYVVILFAGGRPNDRENNNSQRSGGGSNFIFINWGNTFNFGSREIDDDVAAAIPIMFKTFEKKLWDEVIDKCGLKKNLEKSCDAYKDLKYTILSSKNDNDKKIISDKDLKHDQYAQFRSDKFGKNEDGMLGKRPENFSKAKKHREAIKYFLNYADKIGQPNSTGYQVS